MSGRTCSALAAAVVAALSLAVAVAPAMAGGSVAAEGAMASTQTFTVPGDYTFIVPVGVHGISVTAIGAAGGPCFAAAGGRGASVLGIVSASPGQKLFVRVGGPGGGEVKCAINSPGAGGTGGGGIGGIGTGVNQAVNGGGGGGASAIGQADLLGAPVFSGLMFVAGGGGGATRARFGGDAGTAGVDGGIGSAGGGQSGTQVAGGAGGAGGGPGSAGAAGTALTGGAGGAGLGGTGSQGGGGGGGGGYYGGGGGGGAGAPLQTAGSGGGGSSYITSAAANVGGPTVTDSAPSVTLTWPASVAPTAAVSAPATGGYYPLGQSVPTSFSCLEGQFGAGLASCNDSTGTKTTSGGSGQLDTSNPGVHSYTVTATSINGLSKTTSITYTVQGPPTVTIATPSSGDTYTLGQVVATSFSCAQSAGGPWLFACNDSNDVTTLSGGNGQLDTSTLGAHTYTVTATSVGAFTNTSSITYTVSAPATPGGPTTPGGATTPSAAKIAADIARQLVPAGGSAKIAGVLKSGAFAQSFKAPVAGTTVIGWYYLPPGAKLAAKAKAKPVLVATGKQTFSAAGAATVKIKLTSAGRKLLKNAKRIKLTAKCTFTQTGKRPVVTMKTFVLKR